MKRKLFLMLALLLTAWTLSAQTDTAAEKMARATELLGKGDYAVSLDLYRQAARELEQAGQEADSLCYTAWIMMGKCHYRMEKVDEAINDVKNARSLYAKHRDTTSADYADLLDNLSLYCASDRRFNEAEQYSNEAVEIYFKLMTNDFDMSLVLIHAAEAKYYMCMYAEAVSLQQHALNILAEVEHVHTDHYIAELDYLKRYLHEAGNTAREQEVEAEIERLKEEQKYGYVPALTDFTTVEKCREHRVDAYYCCRYYLNHYLSAPKMGEAASYILKWTMSTDELTVNIGEPESKWINDSTQVYLIAYLAGNTMYALENPDNCNSLQQYTHGITSMLDYYQNNKELTGSVPAFDDYLELYARKEDRLFDRINRDYRQFEKSKAKGEGKSLTGDRK